jgi:predicted nucleotidyltransferase
MIPEQKQSTVAEMVEALSGVKGIEAIVLAGSCARGRAKPDSDVDLALYYVENSPPPLEQIRKIAALFDANGIVTNFYEWGPWVNGGAWLNTPNGEVDWLYRNIDQVQRVIAEAARGVFSWDFRQQLPFGFFSVMYLGDLQQNIPLYDPNRQIAKLKEAAAAYPEAMRNAQIQEHLWSIEFTLFNAKKLAKRGSIYGTAGCVTRMAAELTQALFALNRVYTQTPSKFGISALPKPRDSTIVNRSILLILTCLRSLNRGSFGFAENQILKVFGYISSPKRRPLKR